MPSIHALNRKWQQCWIDRSRQPEIDLLFRLLTNAYSKPDRCYHNLNHIQQVLTTIDRFTSQLQDPIAVRLAAWFHDFVYDSQAADNEFQSAKLASELLTELNLAPATIDRVCQLILATQGHQTDAADIDRSIFLDADLAAHHQTNIKATLDRSAKNIAGSPIQLTKLDALVC
jgi:predicted metal-dependent HD superfamily phosphohydrolase